MILKLSLDFDMTFVFDMENNSRIGLLGLCKCGSLESSGVWKAGGLCTRATLATTAPGFEWRLPLEPLCLFEILSDLASHDVFYVESNLFLHQHNPIVDGESTAGDFMNNDISFPFCSTQTYSIPIEPSSQSYC